MRRLLARFTITNRPLQDRLGLLIALAVAAAVAITGVAAYFVTLLVVYDQLDNELVDAASIYAGSLSEDLENMGGIDSSSTQAANVTVLVVRSDSYVFTMNGNRTTFDVGADELAVARTAMGWSSRTGVNSEGELTRIVAVPLVDGDVRYALVLGRPLAPTLAILQTTGFSLLVFGAIGATVAAAAGRAIARSGIEPLRRLSDAVANVTATNKLTPIEVGTGDDEVAELGRSFNQMLKALDSSRERQRRLIADAGHELRTPLTSMRTNVELLVADERQGMLPEGARAEILRDVAAQLGEFTSLVGDLVQLSREESPAAPELVDLRDIVENALERVKRRGPGIVWDVELDPLYLMGDEDALERAVTNLLDNAVKFSPPGGTIHVHLEGDRLRVADQGPGIADEDLPHVFERFFRSEHARNTPGSGLGLSIVAQTIQAHSGWVKAGRSAEGGAEFIAHLPGTSTPPTTDEDADDADET